MKISLIIYQALKKLSNLKKKQKKHELFYLRHQIKYSILQNMFKIYFKTMLLLTCAAK